MKIIELIEESIKAGKANSDELYELHDKLDVILGTDIKGSNVRNFFDSWADAIGHSYQVYKERDPAVWLEAAEELRGWYLDLNELSDRALWKECSVKRA